MLKKIRIGVSITFFTIITLYFLDFRELLPQSLHFLAKIQFIPALLALNIIILTSLVLLTFVFGRVYCSGICPMGIYQDVVAWFSKRVKRKRKKRYIYSPAKTILRWATLSIIVVAFLFGFTFLLGLLDPYGAYGRIATHLFRPVYLAGNNLLETIFTQFNNYTFFRVGIYSLSVLSTVIALITLVSVGFFAWRNGRTFCNTLCPVGTVLGFISRFSLFKVQFNNEKCNSCGLCAMKCKASCINSKERIVDYSRCINCFNCIEACNRDAMHYKPIWSKKSEPKESVAVEVNQSKRRFLSATFTTGMAATSLLAQTTTGVSLKRELKRQQPIAPPGVQNIERLLQRCISCHLCVTKCPSHVIKPALFEYGLGGIMQPKLYFDHGFCSYDCTVCGDVCPTGAILPLTKDEKHHTQMGQVNFIIENCIVYYDETSCGACSEHCPTQAVSMIPYKGSLTIPHIEPSICVGCGGCEYVCPAIPFKAIYVEGLKEQQTIELEQEEQVEHVIDDFGF
ncbi:MAG: 4Fe-4S dicluster domain-containing protein [Dysgonamonadaceae bacterium]